MRQRLFPVTAGDEMAFPTSSWHHTEPPRAIFPLAPSAPLSPSAAVLPHIPNDGLAALIHVHMLDTHELGAALAQAPESLDLCNIGPH
jgi:hypothetical protein